ncbi:TlpA family protein disulfide reductase [Spirosoma sp. KNUC1025]|uniref:TlpA family protein disulfide reductase n=1 Tax=Spirosoma sp. KNUC1025 TaxID=2894082 RepID=UPI0038674AD0|nr:redoxin family protein [Spirosoma sp. KNUC1025]
MNLFRIAWLLYLPLAGVAQSQPSPANSIHKNAKTVLKIVYRNNHKVRFIEGYTINLFPPNEEVQIQDSIPIGEGQKWISYPVLSAQQGFLAIDLIGSTIYLVPGDTLTLALDLSQPNPWQSYHYRGQYATINTYYAEQARRLNSIPSLTRAQLAQQAPSLGAYQQKMDSLLRVELQFLTTYSAHTHLPEWFIQQEKLQIRYNDAYLRLNGIDYRNFTNEGRQETVPSTFYRFLNLELVNNPNAIYLLDYHLFLTSYFLYELKREHKPDTPDMIVSLAFTRLKAPIRDIFVSQYVGKILARIPAKGEHLLAQYYPRLTNKEWLDQLKAYYQAKNGLKVGQMAPNFVLPDQADSLIGLKNLRGQVVYLSFWFVGCVPCHKEIPHENELVTYFKDKPVKIVSICLTSPREKWLSSSAQFGISTVNLYADKNWENTLISKYNVDAYPRYVLIDQAGKIVQTHASRPSDKAREEIELLLK